MKEKPGDCEGKKSRIEGEGWHCSRGAQLTALTPALGAQGIVLPISKRGNVMK